MSNKPWKDAERRAARAIGSVRTPLSGGSSHITRSDTLHPKIYLEMKYRQSFATVTQIRKAEVLAKKEGKIAILGLQAKGLKKRYYVIPEELLKIIAEHLSPDEQEEKTEK